VPGAREAEDEREYDRKHPPDGNSQRTGLRAVFRDQELFKPIFVCHASPFFLWMTTDGTAKSSPSLGKWTECFSLNAIANFRRKRGFSGAIQEFRISVAAAAGLGDAFLSTCACFCCMHLCAFGHMAVWACGNGKAQERDMAR